MDTDDEDTDPSNSRLQQYSSTPASGRGVGHDYPCLSKSDVERDPGDSDQQTSSREISLALSVTTGIDSAQSGSDLSTNPSPSLDEESESSPSIFATVNKKRKYERQIVPSFYDFISGRVRKTIKGQAAHRGIVTNRVYPAAEYYFDELRKSQGEAEDGDDGGARLFWRPEIDDHIEDFPDSDLLEAIHRHASNLFAKLGPNSLKFLDETALLALGILVEEAIKVQLGETGYLAFLRPERAGYGDDGDQPGDSSEEDVAAISEDEIDAQEQDSLGSEPEDEQEKWAWKTQKTHRRREAFRKRKVDEQNAEARRVKLEAIKADRQILADEIAAGYTRDDFLTDAEDG